MSSKQHLSTEQDIALMIYGSIKQILQEKDYFYRGYSPEYSHLTDNGERAILSMINTLGPKLIYAIHQEDLERSKNLVVDNLKKEF